MDSKLQQQLTRIPSAQKSSGSIAETAVSVSSSPQQISSEDLYPWQIAFSYKYVRFQFLGSRLNLHSFNTSLVRFTNDWFGLEADVAPAWGDTPIGTAKFLFYGGGPRVAYRYHETYEPWAHVLI